MSALLAAVGFVIVAGYAVGGAVATAYWVYRDAATRGSPRASLWALGVALLVVPVLPAYLFVRRRLPPRRDWRPTDRYAGVVAATLLTGFVVAALVAPPDPVARARWSLALSAVTAPVAYLLTERPDEARQ
ncbi:hypothetical protein [Haloarcula litorea]|uniref:hypothetical protein n=1 Tax=Haloarcula litorea TaxID=3032579 RepID=UPI0023E7A640|nr:hypothetical protein [Halomicroarcula sp. GDY20]